MNISQIPAPVFLAATIVFQAAAHIGLKYASCASPVWAFIAFSVANLAGLAGVLTYTGVLKKLPLHLAFPITQGLVALGVLLVGSYCIFRESFARNEIIGCLLVLAGIILLGLRHALGTQPRGVAMIAILLIATNAIANTAAHICFKLSSAVSRSRNFIFWQVVGNTAAFLGTLAYTVLMHDTSLLVAFPLTQGLTAVGVQVVASLIIFRERISLLAWAGTVLIVAGSIVMKW